MMSRRGKARSFLCSLAMAALLVSSVQGVTPEDTNQSSIARASALSRAVPAMEPEGLNQIRKLLQDRDPLVRRTAVEALATAPPEIRSEWLRPLLADPVKGVRMSVERGGQDRLAVATLENALKLNPTDRDAAAAVVAICNRIGDASCTKRHTSQFPHESPGTR